MIVVVIISILAAIAIPAYQNYTTRAQVSEALSMASSYKGELLAIYGERGVCPASIDMMGAGNSGLTSWVKKRRGLACCWMVSSISPPSSRRHNHSSSVLFSRSV